MQKKIIALIPARSGSKRIKNKNIILFKKKPLLYYSITAAVKSKLFDKIIVSTDSKKYAAIAKKCGAEVPFLRPKSISKSNSPDYEWIKFTLDMLKRESFIFTHFFILRPTSPFRNFKTILRAWRQFNLKKADSLRAISKVTERPEKMWRIKKGYLKPYISGYYKKQPYYNSQSYNFKKIYVQNASLEISKTEVIQKNKTITGNKIIPFFTKGLEGFDLNTISDLKYMKSIDKII